MRKFSELSELTIDQEEFVDRYMYQWGAWVRSGRLDKPQLNIIAKLMQSVIPAEPNEPICDDETGFMISQTIELFFKKNDQILHFIVFAYYVNKRTINFIAEHLHNKAKAKEMRPCAGKSNVRVPSFRTIYREVEKEIHFAKAIIHELLITCFIIQRTSRERAKSIKKIKITY